MQGPYQGPAPITSIKASPKSPSSRGTTLQSRGPRCRTISAEARPAEEPMPMQRRRGEPLQGDFRGSFRRRGKWQRWLCVRCGGRGCRGGVTAAVALLQRRCGSRGGVAAVVEDRSGGVARVAVRLRRWHGTRGGVAAKVVWLQRWQYCRGGVEAVAVWLQWWKLQRRCGSRGGVAAEAVWLQRWCSCSGSVATVAVWLQRWCGCRGNVVAVGVRLRWERGSRGGVAAEAVWLQRGRGRKRRCGSLGSAAKAARAGLHGIMPVMRACLSPTRAPSPPMHACPFLGFPLNHAVRRG